MERSSKQLAQSDRTRYLNIVYFVESARSHTIRINLKYARWAVGFVAIIVTWAAGSVFWILSLKNHVHDTRQRLESSLTTIFDYQIKNDRVFEIAYPADATKSYYSEAAQLASNNPVMDPKSTNPSSGSSSPSSSAQTASRAPEVTVSNQPSSSTVTGSIAKTQPDEKPISARTDPKQAPAVSSTTTSNAPTQKSTIVAASFDSTTPVRSDNAKPLIEVSGAKISRAENKIELNFDINNRRTERAAGYIWAVAAFSSPDGKTSHSGAPYHVQIDTNSGKITSVRSAYRFAILRYKKKNFEFKTPATKDWKLTKVTIHFTDVNHQKEDVVNVPVDQLAISPNPELEQDNKHL
jgi:hypothetical protein